MNREKILGALVSVTLACVAVTAVTASSSINTPLYTYRMEQASNNMNFLPITVNTFTYTAEKGYTLQYEVTGKYCSVSPLATSPASTCNPSCFDTCEDTCEWTCFSTCPETCETCWVSCQNTCPCNPTCPSTCNPTCPSTCITCNEPTCPITCGFTCFVTCDDPTCEPICPPLP